MVLQNIICLRSEIQERLINHANHELTGLRL